MLCLQFYINRDRYIIDTQRIITVVPLVKMRKITGTSRHLPEYLRGFICYGIQTIPVVDLSQLISGQKSKPYLSTRIAITKYIMDEAPHDPVGIMVEKATEVVRLNKQVFTRSATNDEFPPYVDAVAEDSEGLLWQLNVNKLIELKVLGVVDRRAISNA